MDKLNFKQWRKSLNLTQEEAGDKLGMSRRAVQLLEAGDYGRNKEKIDVCIALACAALEAGLKPYGEN